MNPRFTLKQPSHYELEIKKSRFIAYLYPVSNKEQINEHLLQLKQQYPDARHICTAFLCGNASGLNDDGEPSGTAAKPMFSVLQHNNLVDVLAVVVRYFGGIKLGAGGLVRAYGQAVRHALDAGEMQQLIIKTQWSAHITFSLESQLRHWCTQLDIDIVSCNYQHNVQFELSTASNRFKETKNRLFELSAGQIEQFDPIDN